MEIHLLDIWQRQGATPHPPRDILPVDWYLCLPANEIKQHGWIGAKALGTLQN